MTNFSPLFPAQVDAENPEPRCPCALVLDRSGSMDGAPMDALNLGLEQFVAAIARDPVARRRLELAVVDFGSDVRAGAFEPAATFHAPSLSAGGATETGHALQQAIEAVTRRKEALRAAQLAFYRPWIVLITDGEPTDEASSQWAAAKAAIAASPATKGFHFFAVGVPGANVDKLKDLAGGAGTVLQLDGLNFESLFLWLSSSIANSIRSGPAGTTEIAPGLRVHNAA